MEGVFPKESQPCLDRLRVTILDLDQTTKRDPLKVLLALLVYEVTASHGPAFGDTGEGHGAGDGEVEVVGGTDGKVGEELQVLHAVGSQLKVAYREAVLRLPPEGTQVECLDASGKSGVFTESS
jgi:hypothetical protein